MASTEDVKLVVKNFPIERIHDLYDKIKVLIEGKKLDATNIVSITTNAMIFVEAYNDISGIQKRELIIHIIGLIIKDTVDDYEEKFVLQNIVRLTLPSIIDTIINVDKKKIQIKVKKGCSRLFSCCTKKWN